MLLNEVGEMEGAGQSCGAGADDQDIGLKSFALYGHRVISLAEHANVADLRGVWLRLAAS